MTKKSVLFTDRAKKTLNQYAKFLFPVKFSRNNDLQSDPSLKLKTNLIKEPIRYLAIGDSIAAGFHVNLGGIDVLGMFTPATQKVSGWSYPAFLAHYLQQYYQLAYFENYAHSSSKIIDWLYFLGSPLLNYDPEVDLATLRRVQLHNKNNDNPYKNLITKHFGNFQSNDFDGLIQAIKTSNLLTISLSANDFLQEIIWIFQKEPEVFSSKLDLLERINFISDKISHRYQLLVKRILEINPEINLILIGYPMPLLRFGPLLNRYLTNLLIIPGFLGNIPGNNLTELLLNVLNHKIIRKTSLATHVQYLSCYDSSFWHQHARFLVNNPFDIHPTDCGYHHIAAQLLNKLSFSNEQLGKGLSKTWTKFFTKDLSQPILPSDQLTAQQVDQIQQLLSDDNVINFNNPLSDQHLTSLLTRADQSFSLRRILTNSKFLEWSIGCLWNIKDKDNNFWYLINHDGKTNLDSLIKLIINADLNLFVRRFQEFINNPNPVGNFNLINHQNLILALLKAAGFFNGWYWWNYLLKINQNNLTKISQLLLENKKPKYSIMKLIHDLFIIDSRLVHKILTSHLEPLKNLKLPDLTAFFDQLLKHNEYQVLVKILINDLVINFNQYQNIPTFSGLLNRLMINHKQLLSIQLEKIMKYKVFSNWL